MSARHAAAAAIHLSLTLTCVIVARARLRPGADRTVVSMPVRGVWMHPGFFGTEQAAAIEKIR
jgi:hypothetical protein